ncbi:MAG: MC/SLC25 family protein [Rhabdochlamydiaceae bacterium]|nr:MC/SLC25 family protein [Rhabdochlamydiaceae bacterium]
MTSSIFERFEHYIQASLLGAGQGMMALALEHPLDVVKTTSQADPEIRSSWEVARKIYMREGLLGFYKGAIPNGARLALKQSYRYPMMLFFPKLYEEIIPAEVQKAIPDAEPTATAVSLATIETWISCPFERGKVYLMTSQEKNPLRQFFILNKGRLQKELFRGITAVYARQLSSWGSFLIANNRLKTWERNRTQSEKLSFFSLLWISFVIGAINTCVDMPFDTAKTHLQKRTAPLNETLRSTLKKVYLAHGVKGLYAGWRPRMIQYMLQAVYTVSLLEHLEQATKQS